MLKVTEQAQKELKVLLASCEEESIITLFWANKQFDNKRGHNGENIIFQTREEG